MTYFKVKVDVGNESITRYMGTPDYTYDSDSLGNAKYVMRLLLGNHEFKGEIYWYKDWVKYTHQPSWSHGRSYSICQLYDPERFDVSRIKDMEIMELVTQSAAIGIGNPLTNKDEAWMVGEPVGRDEMFSYSCFITL